MNEYAYAVADSACELCFISQYVVTRCCHCLAPIAGVPVVSSFKHQAAILQTVAGISGGMLLQKPCQLCFVNINSNFVNSF